VREKESVWERECVRERKREREKRESNFQRVCKSTVGYISSIEMAESNIEFVRICILMVVKRRRRNFFSKDQKKLQSKKPGPPLHGCQMVYFYA
jgi:hypothetical protein